MAHADGFHGKKRKLNNGTADNHFKPSARFSPTSPRDWTVSVAIPASIIADCATKEQRINSPSSIARALAVFSIDEVVLYDDRPMESRPKAVDEDAYTGDVDPCHYIAHLLSYLETPPFMRKTLFPLHPNLKLQGLLPSLDMPHHPHKDEWLPYREGMTVATKPEKGSGTMVEIGMDKPVQIAEVIPPKTRVTLQMPDEEGGQVVPIHPKAPREEGGYFWGFEIRKCASLSAVFTDSPFEEGYDISIGTSERGRPLTNAFPPTSKAPDFRHLLVVFGGPRGLEYASMNDPELSDMKVSGGRTKELFDHWINVLPNQGSRTIRTDEAVFIGLTGLRRLWDPS